MAIEVVMNPKKESHMAQPLYLMLAMYANYSKYLKVVMGHFFCDWSFFRLI